MAVTFLDPGGDATGSSSFTFWNGFGGAGTPTIVTDFVHGKHVNSTKYAPNVLQTYSKTCLATAGSRFSAYIYLVALPTSATAVLFASHTSAGLDQDTFTVRITSGGVLQIWSGNAGIPAQIGTNGPTLSTGQWNRISLAYTITSTTVNRFELFVNGVSAISITNATLNGTSCLNWIVGNDSTDTTLDFRSSDHYVDNLTTLVDTGDVWVTAKRPFANGTTTGFTTQIGAAGSSYGSGHAQQVNERPLSTTNGWSMVGAGSAVTEEYSIELPYIGDINISLGREAVQYIDFMGWVYASSLSSETAQIIVGGVTSSINLTSSNTMFTAILGSTTYPAGGTDIGIITTTALTTVSLFECGVVAAYIPTPQDRIANYSPYISVGDGMSRSERAT